MQFYWSNNWIGSLHVDTSQPSPPQHKHPSTKQHLTCQNHDNIHTMPTFLVSWTKKRLKVQDDLAWTHLRRLKVYSSRKFLCLSWFKVLSCSSSICFNSWVNRGRGGEKKKTPHSVMIKKVQLALKLSHTVSNNPPRKEKHGPAFSKWAQVQTILNLELGTKPEMERLWLPIKPLLSSTAAFGILTLYITLGLSLNYNKPRFCWHLG